MVHTGATFADASAEYLRYIGQDRGRKASTIHDYRSILRVHLLPAFGPTAIEDVTARDVDAFASALVARRFNGRPITARTRIKILNVLHGVFCERQKVWGLPFNPAADVERPPQRYSGDIEVCSPERSTYRSGRGSSATPPSTRLQPSPGCNRGTATLQWRKFRSRDR